MLNKAILQGRITRDIEVQQTESGTPFCKFTIATDRMVKAGAEKKADFIDCSCWSKTAEFLGKYFKKGSEILVCGSLQADTYETKDGQKRTRTYINVNEVNFCGSAKDQKQDDEPHFEEVKSADLPF